MDENKKRSRRNIRVSEIKEKIKSKRVDSIKKGVYLIPNLCTMGNLFCGFYAIVAVLNKNMIVASEFILFSLVFDGLDGKLARLTKSDSRFGVEFDSLADLVSFGIAPAILTYQWALHPYGRIGWLAAFLYAACGAMRLARFNVMVNSDEKKYFTGLPIPSAAALIASFVILHQYLFHVNETKSVFIAILMYVLAFLMVSNIKYRSFKDVKFKQKKPFSILVASLLILVVIIAAPQISFFIIFAAYPISGIVERFPFYKYLPLYKKAHTKLP